jgi:glycosyltransferase involved in cell wall biosynthesis
MSRRPDIPVSDHDDYQAWLAVNHPGLADLERICTEAGRLPRKPIVSVILPVYNPPSVFLREAIDSVLTQAYPGWQLCIADDGSTQSETRPVLEEYAAGDPRIRIVWHSTNRGIVAASNSALALASGDFVAFLDQDDVLTPDALYEIAALINRQPRADMIYSDEDKIDDEGKLSGPVFKPDWCPDSFLSRMYTCHLSAYRRLLVEQLGGFRDGYDGGQSYDLVLRLTEVTGEIHHIPKVLYHWRMHQGSTAADATQKLFVYEADKRALQDAIDRRGEPGQVVRVPGELGFYVVRYQIREMKRVSIIIPSKDHGDVLDNCLESIFSRSTYPSFEVVLVDNGSTELRAQEVVEAWVAREPERFRPYRLDIPFNFSTLCNEGVKRARGDFLLFLNNDTEVITADWIEAMVEQAQRPSIGAVGALLLYEDGTIQHAGAILGLGGLAAHSHRGYPSTSPGYMSQIITMNNYLSVAGSCLMIRRALFEEVGGFEERLPGDYEDVDLCLTLVKRGFRNIYLPHVRLYHHESISRGRDYVERDPTQRIRATDFIRRRWQSYIDHDPCYNPNLTRAAENYALDVAAIECAETRARLPRLESFHCVVDRVTVYNGRGIRLRGSAMTRDGGPVERIAVSVDGEMKGDASCGHAAPDAALPTHSNDRAGFYFTTKAAHRLPRRVAITLTLFGPGGAGESFSISAATYARTPRAWRRPRAAVRARATKLVRRIVDAFHRRFPTFLEVKGRGTRAACLGIVRRGSVRLGVHGILEVLGGRFPALSERFGLDVPLTDDPSYRDWLRREYPDRRRLASMQRDVARLAYRPTISVLLPVHDIEARYLTQTIESVRAQVYPFWELCIADDGSTAPHVRPLLESYARRDPRIKVVFRGRCGNISAASNSALALATGAFVAQLDHDDRLAPHALYEVAALLNDQPDTDYIYSDEDKIDVFNIHQDPFFKPDWCPDSFLTKMYTCHLGVYRRTLVEAIGGFRSARDGAEDYDLVLRVVERTDRIAHIPAVLYHWRMHPKSVATGSRGVKRWAYAAAVRALQDALDRRGESGRVSRIPGTIGFYDVRYAIRSQDRVSIIIPTRDAPRLLDRCLLSVFEGSTYSNLEVIVVDNGSPGAETRRVLAKWRGRQPVRFRSLRLDVPFNFSSLCNAGARDAAGQFLLFLNDDTRVISPDWIESMLEHAQRPTIGAVGAQLLYPDNTVQHAGVVVGIAGTAGHAHRGAPADAPYYFGRLNTLSNVSAVTGACLMCRRHTFEELGGFDETFDAAFNDVDLCLRMLDRGLRNIYVPHVKLYHLESTTWKRTDAETQRQAYARGTEHFRRRWAGYIAHDPCYSPHLTRVSENYAIRAGHEALSTV